MGADSHISEVYSILQFRHDTPSCIHLPLSDMMRSLDVHRTFNVARMERWELRNANTERTKALEYLVHCKVHVNGSDEEGERTLLWCSIARLLGDPGQPIDRDDLQEMISSFNAEMEHAQNDEMSDF